MDYLSHETVQDPNAVEELFCKPLEENGEIEELKSNFQENLIFIALYEDSQIDVLYENIEKEFWQIPILKERISRMNIGIDKRALITMAFICNTPGKSVMYAYYLAYKAKKLGITEITYDVMLSKIFPSGFFSEKTLEKYWDKQKVRSEGGSDNLLDYDEASKSLFNPVKS